MRAASNGIRGYSSRRSADISIYLFFIINFTYSAPFLSVHKAKSIRKFKY